MKKLLLISLCSLFAFLPYLTKAQISLNVKVNIGSQPVWGPSGYDYVEYYYMPEIDVYYDVTRRMYIYEQRKRWIYSRYLPTQFRGYNLYDGYKVVINEAKPYMQHGIYKRKYEGYRQYERQAIIRNSKDPRYFQIKNHPEHAKWKKGNKKGKH